MVIFCSNSTYKKSSVCFHCKCCRKLELVGAIELLPYSWAKSWPICNICHSGLGTTSTILCSASYVSWQRETACICCWVPLVQQLIDISRPPGPQQQTCHTSMWSANDWTDGQTDGQMLGSFTDPAPHTMQAVSIIPLHYRHITINQGRVANPRPIATIKKLLPSRVTASSRENSQPQRSCLHPAG